VPWWSQLANNADKYIDWWNGSRIIVFDNAKDQPMLHPSS
jgi:hypothetical protein